MELRSSTVTRILKKAGVLRDSDQGFDSYFIRGGRLFGQNISFHSWKERTYAAQDLCAVSPDEADLFLRLSEKDRAEDEARRAKEEARRASLKHDRDVWLASLPDKIGEYSINKKKDAVEDSYGNYLCGLPAATLNIDELERWIDEHSYVE
jgi:hypothetical protein